MTKIWLLIDKKNIWNKLYPYLVTALFLSLSILLIVNHECWRDEVRAWLLGSEASSLVEFIDNMRASEGHPYLWSGILYFISHYISDNLESIKIVHILISTATVFLFLKFAPFNKIIKALFVFGYFFFYEYSIISRNYAWGILFVIVFCILYKNKYKNIIPIAIALFLMGQGNVYSFLLSIILFIYLLVEFILDFKQTEYKHKRNFYIASAIIASEIFFIYWQLGYQYFNRAYGSDFLSFLSKPIKEILLSLYEVMGGFIEAFMPIPQLNVTFWNTNIITAIPFKFIVAIIFLALFVTPFFIIKKRLLILYISGSFLLALIPLFIYRAYLRHYGHFFILFLSCLWISKYGECKCSYLISKETVKKITTIFLIVILASSLFGSAVAFYFDYNYPFSSAKLVAEYIKKNFKEDNLFIMGYHDIYIEPISGYLDKEFYYHQSTVPEKVKKLSRWGERTWDINLSEFIDKAKYFSEKYTNVLVIISNPHTDFEQEVFRKNNFKQIKKFTSSIVYPECYYLYVYDKDLGLKSFITELFEHWVCRKPTQKELNFYVDNLREKDIGLRNLLKIIILDNEKTKEISDYHFIKLLYKSLLGRDPDLNGFNHWYKFLKETNRKEVLKNFLGTEEFAKVVKDYDIEL